MAGTLGPTGVIGYTGSTGIQGIEGTVGSTGTTGGQGASGAQGIQGATGGVGTSGDLGPTGVAGANGIAGTNGLQGIEGAIGPTGLVGATGGSGTAGAQGVQGVPGATGSIGMTGATGASGTNGSNGTSGLTTYAYIYNLGAQVVALDAAVTLDTNGLLTPGISHSAGLAPIVVANAGVYDIAFSTAGSEPSQMGIFINGVPAPGTVYASGAGTQQNNGHVLLALSAGDSLTLNNHLSAAAVTLATPIGGTAASVNASMLIKKLN
jgi:hypothetical protein